MTCTAPRIAPWCPTGTVVILATGPSLCQEDVDACREHTVIAVNDAVRLAPWAQVLYSSDRFWWTAHRGWPPFQGLRVGIEPSSRRMRLHPNPLLAVVPGIQILRNTGYLGLETSPDGLRTCNNNSGGAAVNLAVHLGARRIVLLGFDMSDAKGSHFFGPHGHGMPNTHAFPLWLRGFDAMVAPLAKLGVRVLNCTRETNLTAFPRVTLASALADGVLAWTP